MLVGEARGWLGMGKGVSWLYQGWGALVQCAAIKSIKCSWGRDAVQCSGTGTMSPEDQFWGDATALRLHCTLSKVEVWRRLGSLWWYCCHSLAKLIGQPSSFLDLDGLHSSRTKPLGPRQRLVKPQLLLMITRSGFNWARPCLIDPTEQNGDCSGMMKTNSVP